MEQGVGNYIHVISYSTAALLLSYGFLSLFKDAHPWAPFFCFLYFSVHPCNSLIRQQQGCCLMFFISFWDAHPWAPFFCFLYFSVRPCNSLIRDVQKVQLAVVELVETTIFCAMVILAGGCEKKFICVLIIKFNLFAKISFPEINKFIIIKLHGSQYF